MFLRNLSDADICVFVAVWDCGRHLINNIAKWGNPSLGENQSFSSTAVQFSLSEWMTFLSPSPLCTCTAYIPPLADFVSQPRDDAYAICPARATRRTSDAKKLRHYCHAFGASKLFSALHWGSIQLNLNRLFNRIFNRAFSITVCPILL